MVLKEMGRFVPYSSTGSEALILFTVGGAAQKDGFCLNCSVYFGGMRFSWQ